MLEKMALKSQTAHKERLIVDPLEVDDYIETPLELGSQEICIETTPGDDGSWLITLYLEENSLDITIPAELSLKTIEDTYKYFIDNTLRLTKPLTEGMPEKVLDPQATYDFFVDRLTLLRQTNTITWIQEEDAYTALDPCVTEDEFISVPNKAVKMVIEAERESDYFCYKFNPESQAVRCAMEVARCIFTHHVNYKAEEFLWFDGERYLSKEEATQRFRATYAPHEGAAPVPIRTRIFT